MSTLTDDAFVSVIVAARNASATLPLLLRGLDAQTLRRDRFELLIVDDASVDDTAGVVREHPMAELLHTVEHGGPAVARNIALRQARGNVLAIIDADCRPGPTWLQQALEDLDATGADLLGGHVEVQLGARPSLTELVDFSRYMDQLRTIDEGGFAVTANLILRRAVLDRVGLFNERLITGEDREFCLRATHAGCTLAYSRDAAVCHEPRRRARELARKCFRYGVGEALSGKYAAGPARRPGRIWTRPGAYLLRRGVYGSQRVYGYGYRPSRPEVVGMHLAEYFLVQLPMVAGSFVGSVRHTRSRAVRASCGRRAASPPDDHR